MNASLKYAHVEREQRFLLVVVPADWTRVPTKEIRDRYLVGTRLRLRLVEEPGRAPGMKLGQKAPISTTPLPAVAHTTIYLDHDEYSALAVLPGHQLHKTRRTVTEHGRLIAVDEFHDELDGLILAEVDLADHAPPVSELAIPAVAEVSEDERFRGGALATMTAENLSALLKEFGL